jgi:hypothetical protein
VWNTFLGYLTSTYTASTWTLDTAIKMTRIQAQAVVPPMACTSNAVLTVSDGTPAGTTSLAITGASSDSGPRAVNYAAGSTLTLKISTAANCPQGAPPALVNTIVQYKAQ